MPKIQAVTLSENGIVPVLSEVCGVRTVWRGCVEVSCDCAYVSAALPCCRPRCSLNDIIRAIRSQG